MKYYPQKFKFFYLFIFSGLLFFVYSYSVEPHQIVLNEQTINVKQWKNDFENLKIVAISDIHGGSNGVTEEKIREIVEHINDQNPDLVFLLGDYVSEEFFDQAKLRMPIETIAENLAGINSKYGVYAVLGNHDGRFGDRKTRIELEKAGITVLEDEVAIVNINSRKLRILGLRDHMKIMSWKEFQTRTRQILETHENDSDLIVLQHSPDVFPVMSGNEFLTKNMRLFLAGHTHGGQIRFPLIGSPVIPSSYGQKYARGHIRENDLDLFVTTGIGTSVLPFRFMMPPEIAVLTIKAE